MINKTERFLNWLAPSFQGENNTSSSRRVTAFWFVVLSTQNLFLYQVLIAFIITMKVPVDDKILELIEKVKEMQVLLLAMVLLLLGILTIQHIIQLKNGKTNGSTIPNPKNDQASNVG